MRFKTLLTTVLVAGMLVIGVDYVALAATGSGFVLGRANSASSVTTLTRSTSGSALSLKTKSGSPPLTVNRSTKVARLNADLVDGLDGAKLRSKVTAFQAPGCKSIALLHQGTEGKVDDLGTFTTTGTTRFTRIDFNTVLRVTSMGTGVTYTLKVDNAASTLGTSAILVREAGTSLNHSMMAVFRNLPAGTHTVSLWAAAHGGQATGVSYDPGCFNAGGVNYVHVEQMG